MEGYWNRIASESGSASDEFTYDLLSPLCVLADGHACIAVYKAEGIPTLEVATLPTESVPPMLLVSSSFNPKAACLEVEDLRKSVTIAIQEALKQH
jgi:hypothetical protein